MDNLDMSLLLPLGVLACILLGWLLVVVPHIDSTSSSPDEQYKLAYFCAKSTVDNFNLSINETRDLTCLIAVTPYDAPIKESMFRNASLKTLKAYAYNLECIGFGEEQDDG